MNKARRERLEKVLEQLEDIQSEEQEAHDNLPESLQDGDRGVAMQEAADALDEAMEAVKTAIDQ